MKTVMSLLWMLSVVNFFFSCDQAEPEDYLIPKGYKGRVNIIFNQKRGVPPKYENGKRVYVIPRNGILLTQFKDQYGFINHHYYYVDNDNKRTPLKIFWYNNFVDSTSKANRNEVGIFSDATSGVYGNNDVKYEEFDVSDYFSLDSLESKSDIMKRVQDILKNNFQPGTLTDTEMNKIDEIFSRKDSTKKRNN